MSGRWQMMCQNAGGEYVGPVLEADSGMKRKKRNSHCGLARKWLFFSFEAGMKCSLHAYPVEMRFSGEADGIL